MNLLSCYRAGLSLSHIQRPVSDHPGPALSTNSRKSSIKMATKVFQFVSALKEKLAEKPTFKVVAMPDFYLDYILAYPGKLDDMAQGMVDVAGRGGGNILGWKHLVGRGGNASNFSAQLLKLGVNVSPIIETDDFGKLALTHFLRDADLSRVRSTGALSRTLAFEAEYAGRHCIQLEPEPEGDGIGGGGVSDCEDRGKRGDFL